MERLQHHRGAVPRLARRGVLQLILKAAIQQILPAGRRGFQQLAALAEGPTAVPPRGRPVTGGGDLHAAARGAGGRPGWAPLSVHQSAGPVPGRPGTRPPGPVDRARREGQLGGLARLAPDWAVSYGDQLVNQALIRWPDQAQPLAQQWRQQL
ncbi:hypothetical protein G6X41_15260, partial [Staphylococcus aureus]|nr:hypothetical protein [Staphylococcus aureus]